MRRILINLFCVFFIIQLNAISLPELKWAIFHPIAAIKVKKIKRSCDKFYQDSSLVFQLDRYENGGKLDAFRHVFYMSAFSQRVKIKKLRKLGIAHEKGNYKQFLKGRLEHGELPDSLGSVMDLKNNEIAFQLINQTQNLNLQELKEVIIRLIQNNGVNYILRDEQGNYLNCSKLKITITQSWQNQICLIAPVNSQN
jgi:hypothetical protein